jgi:hypothetical protein
MYALLASAALFGAALGAPASIPPSSTASVAATNTLSNGFPTLGTQALAAVEAAAHGTLPNGGPPPNGTISDLGITSIQLINYNENFESFFFSSLINNITINAPGFNIPNNDERNYILEALTAVLAQEELHATLATALLKSQGKQPILPCSYQFGTTTFADAIKTAALFTDVVLGTLQDVQINFSNGNTGDKALIPGVASVIAQEGEQDGFYRILEKANLIPSELPFVTRSTIKFAFSALNQNFVVPGSCPNVNEIDLPTFGTLKVVTTDIKPETDQTLSFSVDLRTLGGVNLPNMPSTSNYQNYNWEENLAVYYINQQNVPVTANVSNINTNAVPVVTFDADFPASSTNFNGLTIAAVAIAGNFTNAEQVANSTLFGPGLIDVN